ncbi:MAG TPA: Stp1/IreP family PP2C-type Ser/Thr phosphatase [Smithellaceae bacterium]|nr:Stp1/IreP family PP2C-type Ser/Thr phosphatase [Smithellaceae bacterium]
MAGIIFSGKSDVGLRRLNNEDSYLIKPELELCAVADGMGGAASGEVASRMFCETVRELFSQAETRSVEDALKAMHAIFQLANERILDKAKLEPEHSGMGCTAELLKFCDGMYILGHVGDSRVYLFRKGQLKQLSKDHSLVQEQLEQGLISAIEAKTHSLRHIILRAVGINDSLAVDFIKGRTVSGDIFLLCSDGLSDMIDDPAIQQVLSLSDGLDRKTDALIEAAKSAGGHDNVTVVLCEVAF